MTGVRFFATPERSPSADPRTVGTGDAQVAFEQEVVVIASGS